jgi:hypothetical protein
LRAKASSRCVSDTALSPARSALRSNPPVVTVLHLAQHDADIADDHRQQIVEVVCDATGQLAQAFHLLTLAKLLLRALPLLNFRLPQADDTAFLLRPPRSDLQRQHHANRGNRGDHTIDGDIAVPRPQDRCLIKMQTDVDRIFG